MPTIGEARDEMLAIMDGVFTAVGIPMDINWEGDDTPLEELDITRPLVRVRVRHLTNGQETLMGADGQRRLVARGFINAQILVPVGEGFALTTAEAVAWPLIEAYATAGGSVLYRRPTAREAPINTGKFQMNFTTEFEYSSIVGTFTPP